MPGRVGLAPQQFDELLHGPIGLPQLTQQCAYPDFSMIRNGEVLAHSRFFQNHVASPRALNSAIRRVPKPGQSLGPKRQAKEAFSYAGTGTGIVTSANSMARGNPYSIRPSKISRTS